MSRSGASWLCGIVLGLTISGCAHLRVEGDDLQGASRGRPSGGWLVRGVELPPRGSGFLALRSAQEGGQLWGVPRLVRLVRRLGRALAPRHGATPLRFGDLSARVGGRIPRHRSHRNGRDVDLLFFARDATTDEPVVAPDFVRYDRALRSIGRATPLRFDVERNWNVIDALARDHQAGVARVFVAEWLRHALLEFARSRGKDPWVIERAARLMLQPGDSLPHDDHFHVRLACTVRERYHGCVDGTPLWPWMIKDWEKGDAIPNDDEAILDLMEPLAVGVAYGPEDPTRGAALACVAPSETSIEDESLVCR